MNVRIQVIKVYDIDVPDGCDDPVGYAYSLQTTEIESKGRLIDATTDHAQAEDDIEAAVTLLDQ